MLDSRDDADDQDWLFLFRSLGVEELNQPSECVLSRPQLLREHVVDDRHPFSGAGCQFGVAEITAGKLRKSEHPRVIAADDAECGVHGSRSRIGCAGRSDVAAVAEPRERKTRSDGHRFDSGDRSQPIHQREMRLPPSRFVVPGQTRIDLHEQSAVETEPGIGRGRPDHTHHEQSAGSQQEQRERDLADDQSIADPEASRPTPFVGAVSLEIGSRRATGQCQCRPGTEDQRRDETERHGADEDSPVETDVGKTHGDGEHGTQRRQQRCCRPRRQQQPDRASGQREEQTFGEQLPNESRSAATERRPDGQFLPAHMTSRQQQIGEVEARHEQYDHRHEHQEQGHAANSPVPELGMNMSRPLGFDIASE